MRLGDSPGSPGKTGRIRHWAWRGKGGFNGIKWKREKGKGSEAREEIGGLYGVKV